MRPQLAKACRPGSAGAVPSCVVALSLLTIGPMQVAAARSAEPPVSPEVGPLEAPEEPEEPDTPDAQPDKQVAEPTSSPAPSPSQPATATEPTPAASTEPASTLSTEPTPADATVHVHLESTKPEAKLELFEVTQETLGGGGVSFRRVCGAPCDLRLSPSPEYFVSVGKDTQSRKFTIDGFGDRVVVRARPGNRAAVIVGEVLIAVGALSLVGGVGMIVAGKVLDRRPLVLGGGAALGSGLGLLAIGIPLQLAVGRSRVREVTSGVPR